MQKVYEEARKNRERAQLELAEITARAERAQLGITSSAERTRLEKEVLARHIAR